MAAGVVTCGTCGRELRAGLLVCPYDNTRLATEARKSKEELLRGPPKGSHSETILHHDQEPLGVTMPSRAPLTGQKLGDYVVGGLMGSGGMGEVYEGEQPLIGKKVAIKVLKSSVAGDEVNVGRMLAEARAVAAIRHRGIVDIFNFGTLSDGRPYLVMEYLDGEPLDQILRKRVALTPLETVELLEEICSALSAAHGRGIVHRDLKPGNVFVITDTSTRVRYAKLLDFGLAKEHLEPKGQKPATMDGFVVGTPDYIAPEQARGIGVTPKSDLYSLGVMAFEMVSGQLPFVAGSAIETMSMHVHEPAPSVSTVANDIPAPLEQLIASLLAKSPDDRPASANDVRSSLAQMKRKLREGATVISSAESLSGPNTRTQPLSPVEDAPTDSGVVSSKPQSPQTQKTKTSTGRGGLFLALGALLALVTVGVVLAMRAPKPTSQVEELPVEELPRPGTSTPEPDGPTVPDPPVLVTPDPVPTPEDDLAILENAPPGQTAEQLRVAKEKKARVVAFVARREQLKGRLDAALKALKLKVGSSKVLDDGVGQVRGQLDAAKTPEQLNALEASVKDWEARSKK